MIKTILILMTISLTSVALADSMSISKQALQKAKQAQQRADSVYGAWMTTEVLLQKADQAVKKGDAETALKLAKKAQREANLAYEQAIDQQKNWSPPAYIYE